MHFRSLQSLELSPESMGTNVSKGQKRLNMNGNSTILLPRVKTKHGILAKPVVKGTQEVHSSRGSSGMLPGKIFKIKLARIALVAVLRL